MTDSSIIRVAVGLILNHKKEILLATRPGCNDSLWEFPGGKLETGETTPQALVRELLEELAIELECGALTPVTEHVSVQSNKTLLLDAWFMSGYSKPVVPLEGQRYQWCPIETLHQISLYPSNRPIAEALTTWLASQ